ncbi:MAG: amine dehydrogenase [Pseudomonadota bacterium]|nr:amine dehydrogenase [Pseudomonadota bacterium]
MIEHVCARLFRAGSLACMLIAASPALAKGPIESDVSDVATLKPNGPHRFFTSGFRNPYFGIFDADSGKMEGSIPAGYVANLAIAPDNSNFLVSETYWTHGARGQRQDLVTIWDAKTLTLVKEIPLPGRALVGGKIHNFQLSADGSKAYVYIMLPASSVVWLDLKKQVVGGTVEIPGCALIFPWGGSNFASLCADGSLAMVDVGSSGRAAVTHSKPFFDGANDPIYENSFIDPPTGKALFLSYTGLVYPAKLGPDAVIEKPWSIQQAAGFAPSGTGVQELAWRPGGGQPAAYHKASGKLFVLMHMGTYWTHKQGGTEVWVLDTNTKKLIKRIPLQPIPTSGLANDRPPLYATIGVSQDSEKPLIYLVSDEGGGDVVMDAGSGEILRKVESAGGESVLVTGN